MSTETTGTIEARTVVTDRLRRLARAQTRLDALSAELEGELESVRRRRQGAIARLQRRLEAMLVEMEDYCRATRRDLLPEGRKSLATPFGEVAFRKAESALVMDQDVAEGEVCAALKALGLGELVRVRESVDRRALRSAIEEGRLGERELGRMGMALLERDDLFACKLRRDALVAVGGQRA